MSANPPSPSSSPRLPSPPPMAEDQSGAQSPSLTASELKLRPLVAPAQEQAQASRRIRPGTKAVDMAEGPPLLELTEVSTTLPYHSNHVATANLCLSRVDRFILPTHRTPQSPSLRPYPPPHRHSPRHSPRSITPLNPTTRHRSRPLAIRTLPFPCPKSEHGRHLPLRRPPTMLSCHLPRNARLGMAIPLRSARSTKSMLCNRLLLSHTGLGGECPYEPEAFPESSGVWRGRAHGAAASGAAAHQYIPQGLPNFCACVVLAQGHVLEG